MNFHDFTIHPKVMQAIDMQGFKEPTPVQERVIPEAMAGHDIRACAQTGTGKTIAFVIPILQRFLSEEQPKPQSVLILVPTRELGAQVHSVFHEMGRFADVKTTLILGGMNMDRQVRQIRAGAHIVVATPGRLLDHLERRTLHLRNVHTLVFDEADRMLDMGFLPDIRRILSHVPHKRQTMLFSATFPLEIQQMVARFLKDPVSVDLAPSTPANTVSQMIYPVSRLQKEQFLHALLDQANLTSAIIFSRTKHGADVLSAGLRRIGKNVVVIHSDRTQQQRNEALLGFQQKRYQILVATDIAARGLDIKDVSHVINYDVPHHPEDYVHRIGRTGRAQATGDAFTLVSPDEEPFLQRIEGFIKKTLPRGALPNFPYLVPPRLVSKAKSPFETFSRIRRRIPSSRMARFKR